MNEMRQMIPEKSPEKSTVPAPHWPNPWSDVVYVPIEELVDCVRGVGERCADTSGESFIMTRELILTYWKSRGEKLDAYILPCASDYRSHCIGIRYGARDSQYISPCGDPKKVSALLEKYASPCVWCGAPFILDTSTDEVAPMQCVSGELEKNWS